jgi:hypothetical protein
MVSPIDSTGVSGSFSDWGSFEAVLDNDLLREQAISKSDPDSHTSLRLSHGEFQRVRRSTSAPPDRI